MLASKPTSSKAEFYVSEFSNVANQMQERKQNEIVNCWIDIDLVGEIIFLGQCNNEIFNGLRSSRSSRLGNKKNMDSTLKMNLSCTHLLLFLDVTRIVLKAVMGSVP